MELKTRNVFIDTSVFVNENFGLRSAAFRPLLSLARMGSVFVKLTNVTLNEVETKIRESIHAASRELHQKRREVRVLRNFEDGRFACLFDPLDPDPLARQLWEQLEHELQESAVQVLDAFQVPPAHVFKSYFGGQPPFGPGRKKNEFPDAFVIRALEDWCRKERESMYVVSSDSHMQSACPVVPKKRPPKLPGPVRTAQANEVSRDGTLGHLEAEQEQFPVDSRCAPGWVLPGHPPDKNPNLGVQPRSANLACP